jgi:hypothetical protein
MVDFTEAQIGTQQVGPMGGGGQRPAPVQSPSAAGAALNLFSQLMPTGQQLQQRRQAEQERQSAGFVERFSQQQLAIAEAVDMGELSSQEARMRMRANFAQSISDNPMLMDELTNAQKNIIGTSGLGKVAAEGTEEEQRHNRVLQAATDDGWIRPGMSSEQADEMAGAYLDFQLANEQLSRAQAELTYERGQVGLTRDRLGVQKDQIAISRGQMGIESDRIGLQRLRASVEGEKALGTIAGTYFQKFNSDIQDISRRVEQGELDEVSAQQLLDQQYAVIQNIVRGVGAEARSDLLNNLTAGFDDLYRSAGKYISGELTLEALERRSNVDLAIQNNMITGDPDRARLIATTNIFRHPLTSVLTDRRVTSEVLRMFDENGVEDGPPANLMHPRHRDDTRSYIDVLKPNLRSSAQGTLEEDLNTPEGADPYQEVASHVQQTLRSVSAYSAAVDDPSEFNDVVDLFASDEFREYATSGNLRYDQAEAQSAHEVLMAQYHEVFLPLLRDEWRGANVGTGVLRSGSGVLATGTSEERPIGELIQPSFVGGGFRFSTTSDNPRVRNRVREMNKDVAPVVNRMLRSSAHLERHDNYEKIYRELVEPLFQTQGE